ncbi:MAG: hypothetical protein ACK4QP_14230 [Pseudorhizobium sp.]
MPRLTVHDMRLPFPQYRPDRAEPCERSGHSFETMREAQEEDLHRAAGIRMAAWSTDAPFDRDAALALADRLERSGSLQHGDPGSMASKVYMGLQRICIGGALWQLVDENEGYNVFSVRPRGWLYTAEELAELDPRELINRFRGVINRQRAGGPLGFLIAALHGEFDEDTGLFDVHLHGVADPVMLKVVDSFRALPNFRCRKKLGERPRVVIGRKPLTNLPYPLTYRFQSSWPKRWNGQIDGVDERGNTRHRIPEPYHTALLVWLDRWSLTDITLLMGAHIGGSGFVLRTQITAE